MATRKSAPPPNRLTRILATMFTSLIAPTLVALITTSIRERPMPTTTAAVTVEARKHGTEVAPAAAAAVTLLPPSPVQSRPVVVRAPLVWRPVTGASPVATQRQSAASPGPG
jgi:hypothetical protein